MLLYNKPNRKKMLFLLEYVDYLINIDNKTEIDDNNIYNDFKNEIIVEGLLKTYPSNKSLNIILKRFNELNGEIDSDGEIYLEGNFDNISRYIPIFNNLGYFISKLTIDGSDWIHNYNNDIRPIALYLEAKYDTIIDPLPNILYHATFEIYANRILKKGLSPKTKNKVSSHPDRIYLTDNLEITNNFGKYLLYMKIKEIENMTDLTIDKNIIIEKFKNYNILKFNTENVHMKLFKDVNMKDYGFYTYDFIPPKYIKKVIV
jgi:hypothetical protein